MNVKKIMVVVLIYAKIQLEVTTVIAMMDIICLRVTIKLVLVNKNLQ